YAEGQNLVIERRFAEGQLDRLPGLARDLVQLQMETIVAISTDAIRAAKDATKTIPIVMLGGGNVVGDGFVASLARPGGNITGVVISEAGLAPKRLQLLKEAVPRATRIAMLAPGQEDYKVQRQEVGTAATSLGVTLIVVEARDADYERAFASIAAGAPPLSLWRRAPSSIETGHGSSCWPRSTGCPRFISGASRRRMVA